MTLALAVGVLAPSVACVHWTDQEPDPDEIAAAQAWAVASAASDAGQRAQCELQASLTRLGFAAAARHALLEIVRAGPGHRCFVQAAGELLDGAADPAVALLVSDTVERLGARAFSRFSPEHLYRAKLLLGEAALRAGRWGEARRVLEGDWSIPPGSLSYARAQYLLGAMASSGFLPVGVREVSAFFDRARESAGSDERLGGLTILGMARARRVLGDVRGASALYQQIPQESPWWAQARLEMAWARLLEGDTAGAFGAVKSLQAERTMAAFLPEAPLLEAAILLDGRLYAEADRALESFWTIWRPLTPVLERMAEQARRAGPDLALLDEPSSPPPVRELLAPSPKLASLARAIQASREEQSRIAQVAAFRGAVADGLARGLAADRARLAREVASVFQRRFAEAARRIERLAPVADALRSTARGRLGRAGTAGSDRQALLASALPAVLPAAVQAGGPDWTPAPGSVARVLQVVAQAFLQAPEEP